MGLRSGLCAGQSSYSTPISTNHFCMDLALCKGALSCWNRKGPYSNCCRKFGITELSGRSFYALVLRCPFSGTKGPSTNHEKQPHAIFPPPPNFRVGTMHSGWLRSPGIFQTQINLSDCQMVCVWLSSCADVASRDSLEFSSECCNSGQMIFTQYTLQHLVVLFCCLPLRSWAVVAPRRFHFTITALTVDLSNSSRAEIDKPTCCKGGILWRCNVESHWALQ
jgi:hypothetical protein